MSIFFPTPRKEELSPGVNSLIFDCGSTTVLVSSIAPGAKLDSHQHQQCQIGMSLNGQFEIDIAGQRKLLKPLQDAYIAGSNVLHGAINLSNQEVLGLDIKCFHSKVDGSKFLELCDEKDLKTGISFSFFNGLWFEIMIAKIPPGGVMHKHHHRQTQIGVACRGKYIMSVGGEEEEFEFGKVYYSPPNVPHGAYNPFSQEALSVNIFFPPRYHRFS
ncbi:cupin domain-containing protein [Leptolyngbya sp. 7M]|uniref:cupin domain-containing protein n=1 Tax=Leptolyngbya sp. 7M TaxID=2812896 RepID=UPI001B8C42E1|nr:cupin domain-containing protein [Leptolyngbya sp. 7M]QYO67518.1 cupin domain-containing protein [Leptolyngbya sp. 7M]